MKSMPLPCMTAGCACSGERVCRTSTLRAACACMCVCVGVARVAINQPPVAHTDASFVVVVAVVVVVGTCSEELRHWHGVSMGAHGRTPVAKHLTALQDNSLHVLSSNPLTLHSFASKDASAEAGKPAQLARAELDLRRLFLPDIMGGLTFKKGWKVDTDHTAALAALPTTGEVGVAVPNAGMRPRWKVVGVGST